MWWEVKKNQPRMNADERGYQPPPAPVLLLYPRLSAFIRGFIPPLSPTT